MKNIILQKKTHTKTQCIISSLSEQYSMVQQTWNLNHRLPTSPTTNKCNENDNIEVKIRKINCISCCISNELEKKCRHVMWHIK